MILMKRKKDLVQSFSKCFIIYIIYRFYLQIVCKILRNLYSVIFGILEEHCVAELTENKHGKISLSSTKKKRTYLYVKTYRLI